MRSLGIAISCNSFCCINVVMESNKSMQHMSNITFKTIRINEGTKFANVVFIMQRKYLLQCCIEHCKL